MNAYFTMSSMCDLKKANIHRDTDLVKFPWERRRIDPGNQPTPEEVEELRQKIREENERLAKKAKEKSGI